MFKKGIRQVIRPALKPIQQDVKSNVAEESGALKKGIKVRSGKRSRVSISAQVEVSQDTYKGDRFPGGELDAFLGEAKFLLERALQVLLERLEFLG